MTRRFQVSAAGLSALALLALSNTAMAEEGELQVGVATPFLLYTKTTTELKLDSSKVKSKGSTTLWGVGHDVLGEIGYGVTPNLLVGGLFELRGTSSKDDESGNDGDYSTFNLFVGPKLDFMFLPGDKVQPFVGAVVGLSSASTKFGSDTESHATGFQLMGRAGIRAYVNNKFSLDPQLVVGQAWASGDQTSGDTKLDASVSAFQIGVLLGISGWI